MKSPDYLLVSQPPEIIRIQISYIAHTKFHHRQSSYANTPRQDRHINPKRLSNFWPENSCTSYLHPTKLREFYICFDTRFCERKIRWFELYVLCSKHYSYLFHVSQ